MKLSPILPLAIAAALTSTLTAAPLLETFVESSTYSLSDTDSGPPPGSITSSFEHAVGSNQLSAFASADIGGHSAVSVDGEFASPAFGVNFATARATLTYSTVNNSGAPADYQFAFHIVAPRLQILDFAGLRATSSQAPHAFYRAEILLNDDVVWSSTAELFGGRITHVLDESGTDLGGVFFGGGGRIGYQFSDFSDVLNLGTFASGETITVAAILEVQLESAGIELGASAFIGDPNSLSSAPPFGGDITPVPEPGAASLFAIGVACTAAVRRRAKVC